jgi:hypothetical protein
VWLRLLLQRPVAVLHHHAGAASRPGIFSGIKN